MLNLTEILVFVTGTTSDNIVLAVGRVRENAIIIHYNATKDLLTKIAGKRGGGW